MVQLNYGYPHLSYRYGYPHLGYQAARFIEPRTHNCMACILHGMYILKADTIRVEMYVLRREMVNAK